MGNALCGDSDPGIAPFELLDIGHTEVGTDGHVLPVDEDDAVELRWICGTYDIGPRLVRHFLGRLDIPEPVKAKLRTPGRRIAHSGAFEEVLLHDEPALGQVLHG